MPRSTTPAGAALRAVLLAGAVLAALQLSGALRPVDLLSAAQSGQGSDVILEDFGPSGIPVDDPFDGQYIYVTSRLLPDLDAITEQIHEADYRLVRILHPVLASPAPPGNATIVLLQLWSLVGLGLFAAALADLLSRYGHDPGWAIGASLGACAIPLLMTTSEALAFGLALAGLALADRRRLMWAIPLLALGGLTRESALTISGVAAVVLWSRRDRLAAALVLVLPALPTVAWWAYVQGITEPSRVPLAPLGILQIGDQVWSNIVASIVMLALIVVSVVAWWDVPPLRWLALGFAAWVPLYESFAFKLVGLPRLSSPSLALGVAGLLRWRRERDRPAERRPSRNSGEVSSPGGGR